jgi:hypothetical protein
MMVFLFSKQPALLTGVCVKRRHVSPHSQRRNSRAGAAKFLVQSLRSELFT